MHWILWITIAVLPPTDELQEIEPGTAIRGEVTEESREAAGADGDPRLRGCDYVLVIEDTSTVHIELRSYFFDAFLVLMDESSRVLAEDNDGLVWTHASISKALAPGRYRLLAASRDEGLGIFELAVRSGEPEPPADRAGAEISEARRAVELRSQTLGPDHVRTGQAWDGLGYLYWAADAYVEAEHCMRQALAVARQHHGEDHAETAFAMAQLAAQLTGQGRLADAEALHRAAWKIREEQLGPDDPTTAVSLERLATTLVELGRYAEAEPLMRRALQINETALGPEHEETLFLLNSLAVLLSVSGRDREAATLHRRVLAIKERLYGPDHFSVATSLGNLASTLGELAEYREAEELHRRELEILRSLLEPDDLDLALTLHNLAGLLSQQQRLSEAEELLQEALSIRTAVLGSLHPATASVLESLAGLRQEQARHAEAEELYRRTLAIREQTIGPDHPDTALSLNNLASLLVELARYEEAEALYNRGRKIWEAVEPQHPSHATLLSNLANLLHDRGVLTEAESLHRRSLAIREAAYGPDHPDTAVSSNNLATLLKDLGRITEAEWLYRRALEIQEQALGASNVAVATSLNNLGNLLSELGRTGEAESMLRRALAIREAIYGEGHFQTGAVLNNLSLCLKDQGKCREASQLQRRSLAITQATFGADHPKVAVNLNNLALTLAGHGQHAEAESLLEQVLEIRERTVGPHHPDVAATLSNLTSVLYALGRYDEVLHHEARAIQIWDESQLGNSPDTLVSIDSLLHVHGDLGQADQTFDLADQLCERSMKWALHEIARAPRERRFDVAALHKGRLEHLLSAFALVESPQPYADRVYRHVSAWKGVVYRHAVRIGQAVSRRGAQDPRIDRLRAELVELGGRISRVAYAPRISDLPAHHARLQELRNLQREKEQEILSLLDIEPKRLETDGAELGACLPSGTAVLDFLVCRSLRFADCVDGEVLTKAGWEPERVLCFLTLAGAATVEIVDLGSAAEMAQAVQSYLRSIVPAAQRAGGELSTPRAGGELRELLWNPLAERLAGVTRLIVIPDGFLEELPLEALEVGGGRYLLEFADVVYSRDPVTLRDRLVSGPQAFDAAPSLLAVGGVDYDSRAPLSSRPAQPEAHGESDSPDQVLRFEPVFSRTFDPLPGSAEEVAGLEARMRRKNQDPDAVTVLRRQDATEEAVKSLAPGHTCLHLATHGFFERAGLRSLWEAAMERARVLEHAPGIGATGTGAFARPPGSESNPAALQSVEPGLLAGLVLAGANQTASPDQEDGILTAAEVADLDLRRCRLAVLSACQSALGSGRSGEGLQSLRRSFQEAGAQSVIASLWKIDDEVTRRLMFTFYRGFLEEGLGTGDALRSARLELIADPRTRDPANWAAFTLAGEWR